MGRRGSFLPHILSPRSRAWAGRGSRVPPPQCDQIWDRGSSKGPASVTARHARRQCEAVCRGRADSHVHPPSLCPPNTSDGRRVRPPLGLQASSLLSPFEEAFRGVSQVPRSLNAERPRASVGPLPQEAPGGSSQWTPHRDGEGGFTSDSLGRECRRGAAPPLDGELGRCPSGHLQAQHWTCLHAGHLVLTRW